MGLLVNSGRGEPDLPQTRYFPDRLGLDEYAVVPDEATPQHRRQVADDHQ